MFTVAQEFRFQSRTMLYSARVGRFVEMDTCERCTWLYTYKYNVIIPDTVVVNTTFYHVWSKPSFDGFVDARCTAFRVNTRYLTRARQDVPVRLDRADAGSVRRLHSHLHQAAKRRCVCHRRTPTSIRGRVVSKDLARTTPKRYFEAFFKPCKRTMVVVFSRPFRNGDRSLL